MGGLLFPESARSLLTRTTTLGPKWLYIRNLSAWATTLYPQKRPWGHELDLGARSEHPIGKATYTIELVKEVPASGEFARFSGRTCDKEAQKLRVCDVKDRIYIETGHTLKEEQTTVLHELQHAILGTEKSDRNTTYHQFIYQLSPKLLQVLRENPDLYSYLTASDSK